MEASRSGVALAGEVLRDELQARGVLALLAARGAARRTQRGGHGEGISDGEGLFGRG